MSRAVWIGLGVWYGVWSLLGFGLMGYDKWAARRRPRARIRERTLLTAAFLGGGPLMCVAMRLFHHKTRHAKFVWGLPLCAVLHLLILGACLYKEWIP